MYAVLQVNINEDAKKIVLVEYKHYEKYQNTQNDNCYNLVGTLESDLKSSELLQGFSAAAENRAERYKHQLQQISRYINI